MSLFSGLGNSDRTGDDAAGKDIISVRVCRRCRVTKRAEEFHVGNDGNRGSGRPCKKCRAELHVEYRAANKTALRDKELRKRYGIGIAEYEAMLASQNGRCAICGTARPGGRGNSSFCVDHDHATNKIRALLCRGCNTGVGIFGDSSANLYRAMKYLERFGK